VISSCGHAGISIRCGARRKSAGSRKFTRWSAVSTWSPRPDDYLRQVKKFDLEHVSRCIACGQNFIDLAKQQTPEELVRCTPRSRFTFTT
jgi:hypothetical protein